jgi:hypothetical protein
MPKITTPKLLPEFVILIAGPGFEIGNEDNKIAKELSDLVLGVHDYWTKITQTSQLLYGEDASKRTITRLISGNDTAADNWAVKVATDTGLPLQRVDCENGKASNITTEKSLMLCHVDPSDTYLSQARLIQEDTLRTFSDILIWLGDPFESSHSTKSAFRLLGDTILEGKPIVWIHKDSTMSILDYRKLDEPHRLLLNHNDDLLSPITQLFIDFDSKLLQNELSFIVNPIDARKNTLKHECSERRLHAYFSAKEPTKPNKWFAGKIDRSFSALVRTNGIFKALFKPLSAPWYGVSLDDINASKIIVKPESHINEPQGLLERFEWSDQQANVAAGLRRDITWCLYLLSTLAVFSAVAGVIHLWPTNPDWFWPVTELVTIAAILITYGLASKLDLHGKWLFHRFIAEQIRYTRFGFPLVTFQAPLLAPLRQVRSNKHGDLEIYLLAPETWLFKRIIVSAGLPRLNNRSTYQPDKLCKELRNYVVEVIENQLNYHKKTHKDLHKLEHRLHSLMKIGFVLTALAVVGHFIIHAQWLLIFTAALPSLAAAIHGIVTMNEMGRVSHLSQHTIIELQHLLESISRLDFDNTDNARLFIQLRSLTHEAASIMSNGNRQWQDLIQHQETSLPA